MKYLLTCSCLICRAETTAQSLNAHIRKHMKPPAGRCKNCHKDIFDRRLVFCSLSCNAKFHNPTRKKIKPTETKSFRITINSKRKAWIAQWLNGLIPMHETYFGVNNTPSMNIRRHLIEINGEQCCKCGWKEINPVTGRIPVQLNHIDGDSTNNSPSNVELLCPNCHSLTPTFGRHGKGRKRRRGIGLVAGHLVANQEA